MARRPGRTGLSENQVAEALAIDDSFTVASLDAAGGAEGEDSCRPAETIGSRDPRFDLVVDCLSLRPLPAGLDPRERTVLHLRFGLDMTRSQMGDRIGCSQVHVSRILAHIFRTLRAGLLADPTGSAAV